MAAIWGVLSTRNYSAHNGEHLQGIPQVTVYLDDILIARRTEAEHIKHLEKVLTRLWQAGLLVNKDKYSFMVKAMEYLSYRRRGIASSARGG